MDFSVECIENNETCIWSFPIYTYINWVIQVLQPTNLDKDKVSWRGIIKCQLRYLWAAWTCSFFFYQSVARWFLATGSRTPDIFSRCNWFAHHQNFIPSPVKNLHQSAAAVQSFPVFCASQYIKMWELHWMSPAFCLLVLHTSLYFSLFGLTDIHFGSGGVLNYWRSVPFSAILPFCCRQSTRKACVPPVKHCSDQK